MSRYKVDKCICHKRSFTEILEYARENNYSDLDELKDDKYCSCSCGLCVPYVRLMLETGETEFEPGAYYRRSS